MKEKRSKIVLTDLPDDMLGVILGKVGEASHLHLQACIISCKTLCRISKFPDVLKKLRLDDLFPPPWDRIPENLELLYQCAKSGNVHGLFLSGLTDFYFLKDTITGSSKLFLAAEATHPEAMYLYGMILINQGQLNEGSKYINDLWKKQGFEAVRKCHLNCHHVVLELSVRQYREYDLLLAQIEIGDDCVAGDFDDICDKCFIYKEIFRFIDYLNYF